MPVFTEAELQQQHYREANIDFAVRTTVFLAAANDLARALSGVLLQTMEGVPFLVTACHMAHDDEWRPVEWRPLRMFVPALKRELRDVGDRVSFAPLAPGRSADKPVDVAVVRLRADLHDLLRPLAAPIEVVGDDDRIDPAADVVLLTGFPSYLAFQSLTDPRLILLSTMTHFTGITGHDDLRRLKVDWGDAIPYEDHPRYPHLDVKAGKQMPLGRCASCSISTSISSGK